MKELGKTEDERPKKILLENIKELKYEEIINIA